MIYYMITDGNGHYIRQDDYTKRYTTVGNVTLAKRWEQRVKAANVLKNAINKNLRHRYSIIEIEEGEPQKVEPVIVTPKERASKEIANETAIEDRIDKWATGLSDLQQFVMDAEQRRGELIEMLSNVDKEITDINHYIELSNLNAYQGWLAVDMLKKRLQKRRKIKDELYILTQLGDCKINSSMLADINTAISGLNHRKYAPRVLNSLFE